MKRWSVFNTNYKAIFETGGYIGSYRFKCVAFVAMLRDALVTGYHVNNYVVLLDYVA